MMADEQEKDSGNSAEWMQKLWRPAMGWMYMLICLLDMAVFPVLWSVLQATMHMPITQWNPLTLQGAGLFHIAMGAVLGISAFGRTQEKLAGTAANPTSTQTINTQNMTGNVAGGFGSNQGGMGSGMGGGFGGSSGGFGSGSTTPATGFSGGAPAFGAPASGGFGSSSGGFGATPAPVSTPAFSAPDTTASAIPISGYGGKPAPVQPQQPII
jgi:hypothetical protein